MWAHLATYYRRIPLALVLIMLHSARLDLLTVFLLKCWFSSSHPTLLVRRGKCRSWTHTLLLSAVGPWVLCAVVVWPFLFKLAYLRVLVGAQAKPYIMGDCMGSYFVSFHGTQHEKKIFTKY